MRDPRHRRPGLRNFSVLNVLWNGIQRLWTAVPPEARADMERQGGLFCRGVLANWWVLPLLPSLLASLHCRNLCCCHSAPVLHSPRVSAAPPAGLGAGEVVGAVLGFMRRDIRACHQLLDPGVGKLLLYWLQKARFVVGSYPGAGPGCWGALLEVPLWGFQELALLAAAGGGSSGSGGSSGGGKAVQLAEALRLQVLPKAVALLATCLSSTTAEDQLRVSGWLCGEQMAGVT